MNRAIATRWFAAAAAVGIAAYIALSYIGAHRSARNIATANALNVTLVGNRYWWQVRYPQFNIVTANELHIPSATGSDPRSTLLSIASADTTHFLSTPPLIPATDADPNQLTTLLLNPDATGTYDGVCTPSCDADHPPMLLRIVVQSPTDFAAWVQHQRQPASADDPSIAEGRSIFEHNACVSCHSIAGTRAAGTFGPDLTHLASRATLAAGALPNTRDNLRRFIANPAAVKPGATMPTLPLSPHDLDALTAYLQALN